jgi:hypothetical protein
MRSYLLIPDEDDQSKKGHFILRIVTNDFKILYVEEYNRGRKKMIVIEEERR